MRLLTPSSAVVALVLAACSTSSDGLKSLAMPDQLHLYYEDEEGDYDNRFIANRGFEQDTRALGVGLSWNLTPPPEPARGITREDLQALIQEVRQEAAATAATSAAAVQAASTAQASAAERTAAAIEAAAASQAAAAAEAIAVSASSARREEELLRELTLARLASEAAAQQTVAVEPAASPADAARAEPLEVAPRVEEQVPPAAAEPEPGPAERDGIVGSLEAPRIPEQARGSMTTPILIAAAAVAVLLALQLTPGGRALFARLLGGTGKRT